MSFTRISLILLSSLPLLAQFDRPVRYFPTASAPQLGATCSTATMMVNDYQTGNIYQCIGPTTQPNTGHWALVSTGSGVAPWLEPIPFSRLGTAITAGVTNAVILVTCPIGVAGTDANHYVYLSGGSGTAESVLIAGGTCTSGAATGTIIFTPTFSHSGAYTITSATAGIQEALNVTSASVAAVYLRSGTYIVRAPFTCDAGPRTIYGDGYSSIIKAADNAALQRLGQLTRNCDRFTMHDLSLDGNRTLLGTAQNASSNQYALITSAGSDVSFDHVEWTGAQATSLFVGDSIETSTNVRVTNSSFHDSGGTINASGWGTGIYIGLDGANPAPTNILVQGNSFIDIHNTVTSNGPSAAINAAVAHYVKFIGNYVKNNYNVFGGQVVVGSTTSSTCGSRSTHWQITNNNIVWTTPALSDVTMGVEMCAADSIVTDNILEGSSSNGIQINAGLSNVVVSGNVLRSSASAVCVSAAGAIGALVTSVNVANNTCDGWAWGVNVNAYSRQITVMQNNLVTVPTKILNTATFSDVMIRWNRGIDDVEGGTLASAATISPTQPVHSISGSTTISTITLPSNFSAYNGMTLTLVPSDFVTWATNTSGNIGIASQAVQGQAMSFTYLQTIGKWYPSYTTAGSGSGSPGGSPTQCQYNNAGNFGGVTGCTSDGTTITLVAPILGTPVSGVMTNMTGLPSAGILNNAVTLAKLATQAADTVLTNATAGAAVPTAFAMPTCTGSTKGSLYDTSAHAWTCNTFSGSGDVVGPSSATADCFPLFNGTTGKIIKDSPNCYDTTHNGADLQSGVTSGGLAFSVANVAGTATTLIWPSDSATATNPTLILGAVATCPTLLPASMPATCRFMTWGQVPASTLSGLGTGVATALAANVSGTGAICLASGSSCSGGAGGGWTTIERLFGQCRGDGNLPSNLLGFSVGTGSPGGIGCSGSLPNNSMSYSVLSDATDSGWRTVMEVPAKYDNSRSVVLNIHWAANGTANANVTYTVQTQCMTNMAAADSYNASQTVSTAEGTVQYDFKTSQITSLTMTGCSAGNNLKVNVYRTGSDPSTDAVFFVGLTLDVPVA